MKLLKIDNQMVKEQSLTQMGESMLGNTRMGNIMVKEHSLTQMEVSMLGNTRMGNIMVNIVDPINETMCQGVFSIKKGDTEWAEKSTARN